MGLVTLMDHRSKTPRWNRQGVLFTIPNPMIANAGGAQGKCTDSHEHCLPPLSGDKN